MAKRKSLNIQLFGGPGIGKSTIAAGLFYKLKKKGVKSEYIQEYAKELTFKEDYITLSDQLKLLGEQHHRAYILKNKVDILIHDSPFILGLAYLDKEIFPEKEYTDFIVALYKKYNNINFLIKRDRTYKYETYGRKENFKKALEKDAEIKQILIDNDIQFYEINAKTAVRDIMRILKHLKVF